MCVPMKNNVEQPGDRVRENPSGPGTGTQPLPRMEAGFCGCVLGDTGKISTVDMDKQYQRGVFLQWLQRRKSAAGSIC